jgi:hypothetical protein
MWEFLHRHLLITVACAAILLVGLGFATSATHPVATASHDGHVAIMHHGSAVEQVASTNWTVGANTQRALQGNGAGKTSYDVAMLDHNRYVGQVASTNWTVGVNTLAAMLGDGAGKTELASVANDNSTAGNAALLRVIWLRSSDGFGHRLSKARLAHGRQLVSALPSAPDASGSNYRLAA